MGCRFDGSKGGPFCIYNTVATDGTLSPDYPIDVQAAQMMHDFAITENFVIFYDAALVFSGERMVRENRLPFVTDSSKPSRIGLLRKSEPEKGVFEWFEVEPFFGFHTMNAWEEGDGTVCVALCR